MDGNKHFFLCELYLLKQRHWLLTSLLFSSADEVVPTTLPIESVYNYYSSNKALVLGDHLQALIGSVRILVNHPISVVAKTKNDVVDDRIQQQQHVFLIIYNNTVSASCSLTSFFVVVVYFFFLLLFMLLCSPLLLLVVIQV